MNRDDGNREFVERSYCDDGHKTQDQTLAGDDRSKNFIVPVQPNAEVSQQPAIYPKVQAPETNARAGSLAQTLGLDFRVALIAIVIDTMLFAGEVVTLGLLVVLSAIAGIVFGFITYKAQRSWYGDDHDSAMIKGLIMGLLTAIPSPLPAFLYVPAGVMGAVKRLRDKQSNAQEKGVASF
ncbi:MAG: hypothetical protein IPL32_03615 [Chloracidobacterium sp.]|nr:hypothetical protein [Chloracidobacterium sp.]